MIIDGHAHSCGDFYDVDKLISILDELNVDKVVLCPGPKKLRQKSEFTKYFQYY